MARTGRGRAPAFTLVELLVVIVIILLISAVTLPTVLPALSHRQVSEAARILQAQLVQARDTAIRFNAPRGTRFLPDPTYANATTILGYNRMVPIEPAPEYSNGMVTVWPQPLGRNTATGQYFTQNWVSPLIAYPASTTLGGPASTMYPAWPPSTPTATDSYNATIGQCLMVEQAPFQTNNVTQASNPPTSWFWNVRVGDKIEIANSGNTYTIVGPCVVNPFSSGGANPEMFVNVGQPGDLTNYLTRTYTDTAGNPGTAVPVEFLFLVNGVDDDLDGYVDNGWDGIDNNRGYAYNAIIDDQGNAQNGVATEWEAETWQGSLSAYGGVYSSPTGTQTPVITTNSVPSSNPLAPTFAIPQPSLYTITRRPVPSQSAREVMLPNNVVIDATTWNTTSERSRLPVDPFSKYVDILVQPSGQVIPTTLYSSPASFTLGEAFYHFWIAERTDVHESTELWGATTNPNKGLSFLLPMPQDAFTAYGLSNFTTPPQISLTGERMLVTLFSRTGQITTNSIEFFNCADVNTPFYDSQLGAREAK